MKVLSTLALASVGSASFASSATDAIERDEIAVPKIRMDWIKRWMLPHEERIRESIPKFAKTNEKFAPALKDCEDLLVRDMAKIWDQIIAMYTELDNRRNFDTLAEMSMEMLQIFADWRNDSTTYPQCDVTADEGKWKQLFTMVNRMESDRAGLVKEMRLNFVRWDYLVVESAEWANEMARYRDWPQTGNFIAEAVNRAMFDNTWHPKTAEEVRM